MILRRLLAIAAALGAMMAASAALVVALAFALYALLKPVVTPAGASACVAGALVLLMGVGALLFTLKARGRKEHEDERGGTGLDRFIGFAKNRPIAASAAAAAAGLMALRSPALAGSVMAMLLGGGDKRKGKRR